MESKKNERVTRRITADASECIQCKVIPGEIEVERPYQTVGMEITASCDLYFDKSLLKEFTEDYYIVVMLPYGSHPEGLTDYPAETIHVTAPSPWNVTYGTDPVGRMNFWTISGKKAMLYKNIPITIWFDNIVSNKECGNVSVSISISALKRTETSFETVALHCKTQISKTETPKIISFAAEETSGIKQNDNNGFITAEQMETMDSEPCVNEVYMGPDPAPSPEPPKKKVKLQWNAINAQYGSIYIGQDTIKLKKERLAKEEKGMEGDMEIEIPADIAQTRMVVYSSYGRDDSLSINI